MKAYTITKLLYFKFIRIKVRMLSRHRLAFANLSLPIVFTRKPINAVTIPNLSSSQILYAVMRLL